MPDTALPWPNARPLPAAFFDDDACRLAQRLLGKVLRHRQGARWLSARIIETEAYYLAERGSHASLGYTHARRALFGPGGTIYMYYARGGDSLNVGARGEGNAVLIKSALTWQDAVSGPDSLAQMQANNPRADGSPRPAEQLCAGQTLLCKSLGLKVPQWNARHFDPTEFFIDDVSAPLQGIVCCTRLGIPAGRDEHLPYRFVDLAHVRHCTRNPLRRGQVEGRDYRLLDTP